MNCCNEPLNIGEVEIGDTFTVGIADVTGEYIFELYFLGTKFIKRTTFMAGDYLEFPTEGLNENYVFSGWLYKPNGEKFLLKDNDNKTYECFTFKMIISYDL